jgi:hypothetical protein
LKLFNCSSVIDFYLAYCFAVRVALLNKTPKSYTARCFVLFTSCFPFHIAYNCVIEVRGAVEATNNSGVKEKVLEQHSTKLTA